MNTQRQKASEALLRQITTCEVIFDQMAREEHKFKPYAKKLKKLLADAYFLLEHKMWEDWAREAIPKHEALMKKYAKLQRKKV